MREACSLVWLALVGLFRSRASLEAEILILRHQLNIQRRQSPKRLNFSTLDRLIFVGLYRLAPRLYWRWKSRHRGGRPTVPLEIRELIREMSIANPLWGAPRIHGELLKLGIEIGQTSVAKYMARRKARHPRVGRRSSAIMPTASRRWICSSYRRSHFGCSTHGRRQVLWFGVTAHPTAEWIANQITQACGWKQAPRYLIRDRGAYGEVVVRGGCS